MNYTLQAERIVSEIPDRIKKDPETDPADIANVIAGAQVYATLALANAVENLADVSDALKSIGTELGGISVTIDRLERLR